MSRLVKTLFSALGIGPSMDNIDLHEVADRRQVPRFETELVVQWFGGSGIVRDISSTGVRFETKDQLPADEKMKFTIVIPDDEGDLSYYTLFDSEIHWTAPSPVQPHMLNVGASFTKFKSIGVPIAA